MLAWLNVLGVGWEKGVKMMLAVKISSMIAQILRTLKGSSRIAGAIPLLLIMSIAQEILI